MRLTPPTLRRRNIARLKEHRRWLIKRGDVEDDSASGSESEGEEDSDDETSIPPVRATSIARPSINSTLRVSAAPPRSTTSALTASISRPSASAASTIGSGLVLASQTTIKASLPTAGLGSTLLVGEAEGLPVEEVDSDPDGLSSDDGDDSDDDETTTGTGVATSTTTTGATSSLSLSRTVPTLTAIPHTSETSVTSSSSSSSRGAGQTASPKLTSTPSATRSTAPLSTLLVPASQIDPRPISSTIGAPVQETTAGQALGPQIGEKETTMNGGAVAGVVFGVLAGVSILAVVGFLLLKRLRGRGYDLSSLNPFSRDRSGSDDPARPMTTGTTWTWNRKLWGAASSGPRTTVVSVPPPLPVPKFNPKTNSEMIDDLVQASYAAENGTPPEHTHNHNRQSDLESQSVTHWPPSPGSFINEKAYNALEGPWPPYAPATPAKLKRSSKPPAVTRWLDGILTPRQSVTPQTIPLPQGTMQGTKWQESVLQGLAPPPVPGFAKGKNSNPRNTTVTETTETTSSVVW